MPEVFLSFASPDREVATTIAQYLRESLGARVILDACDAGIAEGWEGGMGAQAILLLLSPASVPKGLDREDWDPLLAHVTGNHLPPLSGVWVEPCAPPKLLQRSGCCRFSWHERPGIDTLRAIGRWVVQVAPEREAHGFVAAPVPGFSNRRSELDRLWQLLVDRPGTVLLAGPEDSGKTALAQQFAHEAAAHFQDVVWGDARPFTPGRTLHVRDHVPAEVPAESAPLVSTILTSRSVPKDVRQPVIEIEPVVGRPDELQAPGDDAALRLWQAMAFCHRHALLFDLAAGIAGLDPTIAATAFHVLEEQRLADPLDRSRIFARLSAHAQRAALLSLPDLESHEALRRRHAELVLARMQRWIESPEYCEDCLPEIPAAWQWGLQYDWPMAADLALRTASYHRSQYRNEEAAALLREAHAEAMARGDTYIGERCEWELSWVEDTPGGDIRPALPAQEQLSLFG